MCNKCDILARKVIEQEEEIKTLSEKLEFKTKLWYRDGLTRSNTIPSYNIDMPFG